MKKPTSARVLLNEREVGRLTQRAGRVSFRYTDRAADRPVLGLRYEYEPLTTEKGMGGGVPIWFANLLPEKGSGLRRMIITQLGVPWINDFHLLTHLGEDLPGAVIVRPDGPDTDEPDIEHAPTVPAARKLSFSLSGMQVKLSMARHGDGFAYEGVGGDWIVKFPSGRLRSLPENEHAIMTWLKLAGVDVPEHRLVAPADLKNIPAGLIEPSERAFAIKRFDREAGARIHQEDFAQIFGLLPQEKDRGHAEDIGQVIQRECPQDLGEFVRRVTACVIVGNTDEHMKNWSLRYLDGRAPRLSPAYDIVCVTAYELFRSDTLTLSLDGQQDTRYLTVDHFRRFAETIGADPEVVAETVRATVAALADSWAEISANCPVPDFVSAHIDARLRTLPLVRA
ncbi:putative kinase Y4dM [Acrocarpospora corrugata]|uniref:Putative kinase Y4dM n=1 Tax=Acrocarpospora corrugata TaxID=35763 RepID=A0A5M3W9K2_9ACTN|nr:HipA domain-containing protein [Acrocarpospora corrugata]GES04692.1 putative kinase Y4dM [Acrocarpospora corrugata]